MSAAALAWAWARVAEGTLSARAALVLLALADNADGWVAPADAGRRATQTNGQYLSALRTLRAAGVMTDADGATVRLAPADAQPSPPPLATPPARPVVARRRATRAEWAAATGIVAEWNRATGQRLTVQAHGAMLVRRLRELHEPHGEAAYNPDRHRALIRALLDGPRWWDGAPSLNLIYGSQAQLERSIAAVEHAPAATGTLARLDAAKRSME